MLRRILFFLVCCFLSSGIIYSMTKEPIKGQNDDDCYPPCCHKVENYGNVYDCLYKERICKVECICVCSYYIEEEDRYETFTHRIGIARGTTYECLPIYDKTGGGDEECNGRAEIADAELCAFLFGSKCELQFNAEACPSEGVFICYITTSTQYQMNKQ